jgi:hypothetical protein
MKTVLVAVILIMVCALLPTVVNAQPDSEESSTTANVVADVQPDTGAPAPDAKHLDEIWRCERYVDDELKAEFEFQPLANDKMVVTYG